MSILALADEARTRMKEEEPERYAAMGARINAELAICKAVAAIHLRAKAAEQATAPADAE